MSRDVERDDASCYSRNYPLDFTVILSEHFND